MAMNPQLYPNGMPVNLYGELFAISRHDVEFKVDKIPSTVWHICPTLFSMLNRLPWIGKVKAKGSIYLSNVRMVFVASKPVGNFFAFDIPLMYVHGEKFNEPLFHCNNISGLVEPVVPETANRALYSTHSFKVLFKGTFRPLFVPIFLSIMDSMRQYNQHTTPVLEPLVDQLHAAQPPVDEMMRHAYVDPNDITKIFLQQPTLENQRILYLPQGNSTMEGRLCTE